MWVPGSVNPWWCDAYIYKISDCVGEMRSMIADPRVWTVSLLMNDPNVSPTLRERPKCDGTQTRKQTPVVVEEEKPA